MYGLAKDADFSFLNDKELIQIAVGEYQIQFHFDGKMSISAWKAPLSFSRATRRFAGARGKLQELRQL